MVSAGDPIICTPFTTLPPSTTTTERQLGNLCEGIEFGFLAHPDDCTKFIMCQSGSQSVFNCDYPKEVFYEGSCVEGLSFSYIFDFFLCHFYLSVL